MRPDVVDPDPDLDPPGPEQPTNAKPRRVASSTQRSSAALARLIGAKQDELAWLNRRESRPKRIIDSRHREANLRPAVVVQRLNRRQRAAFVFDVIPEVGKLSLVSIRPQD